MSPRRKRWSALVVATASAAGAALLLAWPTLGTAGLLLDLAGHTTFPRPLLPGGDAAVTSESLEIPTRHGSITARIDRPEPVARHTLVVLPGVHAAGLDEPRLTRLTRRLAAAGLNVLSVPLPDLRAFRITARSTDIAEDVVVWASRDARLAPHGRVGLAGVSFAGGLALVAAGRQALAGRLSAVLSLGGHGDLGRVLEYLCTGRLPDGTTRPPHDYSLAVVALAAVRHLVPAAEAPALEGGIRLFLDASTDDTLEQRRALALIEEARRLQATMPDASARVLEWVLARDVQALGSRLRPFIADLARDPALSPERSPPARVPVFLLQGRDDNVIPPSETPHLAAYLTAAGTPSVRWLLTPLLSHVGVDTRVQPREWWRLVSFWRALEDALAPS